jgi:putative hemolysin
MVVNIFSSSLSASFFRRVLSGTQLASFAEPITVTVMTVVIIIFGEIAPKTYAIQNSERVSLRVAPLIRTLYAVVTPLRVVLFAVTNRIVLLAGKVLGAHDATLSAGELKTAVSLGHSAGAIGQQEKELIQGILRLEHRKVREMMTTRLEIKAFDITSGLPEILETVREKQYMRIPVYDGDIDNIKGILYAKDLLSTGTRGKSGVKLAEVLRPAYFVPETLEVDVLLEEFKRRRTHIAIVVDEYGSVSGLVTLEDVLELIVGNIYDKVDETATYRVIDEETIRVKGLLSIEDFNELFNADLSDEYVVTIGGYVTHMLGRIPGRGEVFRMKPFEFEITKAQRNRIEEMIVRKGGKRDEA